MAVTKNPQKAGDLTKFEVTCDGEDITSAVTGVNIFQDIFTPTWTCIIGISDTNNIIMVLPIKPGSKIVVTAATQNDSPTDGEKKFNFIVTTIKDKVTISTHHVSYNLSCVHRDFMINQGKRIQKCYSNMKPSEAVSSAISEYIGGSVETHPSDNNFHMIVPNWSPFTFASWCTKIASRSNAADFVFFMKDEGKYAFKSLEKMYSSEDCGILFKRMTSNIKDEQGEAPNVDETITVKNYQFEHYDAISNISSGYYKTKLETYDIINKTWEKKIFSYGDDIAEDKAKKPWDDSIFESEDSNISFMPKHPKMHDGDQTYLDKSDVWQVSRKSNIMKTEQDKLLMQLPGGIKSWEWLGKFCNVDLPNETDMVDDTYDKFFKGKYLITAIGHSLTRSSYMINVEMIKKRLDKKM